MIRRVVRKFFDLEAATGIMLAAATVAGFVTANSSWYNDYIEVLNLKLGLTPESSLSIRDFINDALMSVFFFLIGMELKKEILIGELSSPSRIILPIIAAIGGVIFPALIYSYFNWHLDSNLRGFAIPTATDIAFAYGAVCLFGKRISNPLKIFLVTLAVIDDLIAILIIAIFYTEDLKILYLLLAIIPLLILLILNFYCCKKIIPYLLSGVILWFCIFQSGMHPTIAGVISSLFIPLKSTASSSKKSMLEIAAKNLTPFVNYLILPIFAFANCGIKIDNFSSQELTKPVFLGVTIGLFIGKQFGVMLFSFLAIKLKFCHLPKNSSWLQFYAITIFTGIGFTMSLFISILAFENHQEIFNQTKIAIITGSLLSIACGILVTYIANKSKEKFNDYTK